MKHDYQRTISDFQIIFEEQDLASWQNITNLNECVGNFGEDSLTQVLQMKRYNNLFEKIVSIDNLYLADKKARKNKSNRNDIKEFDKYKDSLLVRLQSTLINQTYTTSKYDTFIIREPKERLIFKLPYYPDRIVHHAIMNILEPIWRSVFITNTYSCIKKRGIHKALYDIQSALKDKQNTVYCLKLDVRKFYPSIDHEILKQIVRKKIKDNKLLALLDGIIDSVEGVPIGNYLSQFFANLYLSYFDHWLKEDKAVKYYFRYADDMVILHSDKEYLRQLLDEIREQLGTLKLEIKSNYQIFKVEDRSISFVGYKIYHDYTLIRKNIKHKMCKKVAAMNKLKHMTYSEYRQQVCSHIGWMKHCNGINLLKKIIKYHQLIEYARSS